MKQRNNLKYNQNLSVKQRFSFRKTFIGLAAVALGSTLYLSNTQNVEADEVNANTNTQVEENQHANSPAPSPQVGQPITAEENQSSQPSQPSQASQASQASQPSQSSTTNQTQASAAITTKATDQNGQETTTVNPDQAKDMMAGQGTVNVHIQLTDLNQNNQQINLDFSNVGQDKDFVFNTNNLADGQETRLDDNWTIKNNGKGQLVANWTNQNEFPTELNLIVPLEGNVRKITSPVSSAAVNLTISSNSSIIIQQKILTANLTPYVDQVQNTEVIKGFPLGTTTVESERHYGNISDSDYQDMNMSDDQTVIQWGAYFNYGAASLNQALQNAIFSLTYGGKQKLIISSIKVFQVPDDMIANAQGHRYGEGDAYPTGGYYYDQITQDSNYSYPFSYYLQQSTNGNSISVNQPNGEFTVPNLPGAARHAYFFQIDTLLDKSEKVPGAGETMTTSVTQGNGEIDTHIVSWTSQITGSGSGTPYPAQPTQHSETSQVTQATDPTTPVAPVTPNQPTAPVVTPDNNNEEPASPQTPNNDQSSSEAQPVLPENNDNSQNDGQKANNDSNSEIDQEFPVRPLSNHVDKKSARKDRSGKPSKEYTAKKQVAKTQDNKTAKNTLPATGAKESRSVILGSLALVLTSILLLADRKKRND